MGVVYKLIPEISSFIVEQKRNQPRVTCQSLAGMVLTKFGQQVSKSSVHELLKQSQVIIPRARKTKEKFQIPSHKKEQIFRELAPFVAINVPPALSNPEPLVEKETLLQEVFEAPLQSVEDTPKEIQESRIVPNIEKEYIKGMGEIFLKSALYDLSFKPVMGIAELSQIETIQNNKLRPEWEYLTKLIIAIKIELEDQNALYIDPRFQGIYGENPKDQNLAAPIERVACEVADYILNNIKPLIIREFVISDSNLIAYDFIMAMQNLPGKRIKKIFLMGDNEETLAEFNQPLMYKRQYIVSTDAKHENFQEFMKDSKMEETWSIPTKNNNGTARILKLEDRIIVTNIESYGYEEITQQYVRRHPFKKLQLESVKHCLAEDITQQPQWFINRLKERALMFFPADFSLVDLQKVLDLEGFEEPIKDKKNKITAIQVHLCPSKDFQNMPTLKRAAENLNSLNIINFQAEKIILYVKVSSE